MTDFIKAKLDNWQLLGDYSAFKDLEGKTEAAISEGKKTVLLGGNEVSADEVIKLIPGYMRKMTSYSKV